MVPLYSDKFSLIVLNLSNILELDLDFYFFSPLPLPPPCGGGGTSFYSYLNKIRTNVPSLLSWPKRPSKS